MFQNSLKVTSTASRILPVIGLLKKQCRSNTLWATKRKPKTAKDLALDYFDTVYGPLFGKKWPSIRLALLSPHKYCAVVNNFSDFDSICTALQNEGAINIRDLFVLHESAQFEKRSTVKRKKKLSEDGFGEKIKQISENKREQELGKLYPSGADLPIPQALSQINSGKEEGSPEKEELIELAKRSLDKSLSEATIDLDRQIDPIEGLSSSRLNDFVPVSKLIGKEDFVSEADHFSLYNDPKEFPVTVQPEDKIYFPSHLQIFTFDQGSISAFSPPKSGSTGVLDYYLMDAGSILPVLVLGLSPGDTVLDMCAAPGGKSLLCLQTLYTDSVVCNDSSLSRLNRLENVMKQYFYDWEKKVVITQGCGTSIEDMNTYSKILVDVPCTNDRLSAMEDDNNIFKPSRNKERILLPQLQVDLLFRALQLVKAGGSVVYSTCSLNPAQNDGVVQVALRRVWEETSMKIVVKDLSKALEPASVVFKFAESHCLRYGSLVVPYLPSNFGPMYFCKLEKVV